ncbi:MAG: hypothetical protein OXT70_04540 [Chloroflexota bacterium]|nr:hypothetical protein [Chloroflexota bacterium]
MNPAQRAKRLQAHSLRCQGLTYRQIGERMRCAHSTAAKYVRDFEANRAEIIESLAADLLVHSVANLQDPDPDLHAQHINAARELRLLVNSLDQVEDRRQKRARRVAMEEEADALKNIQALEDLVVTMHENGIDDMTPYLTDHGAFRTPHFQQPLPQTSPSGGGAPQGRRGPTATTSKATPSPTTPVQPPPNPDHQPTKSAQNRPKSNNTDQDLPQSPAIHAKSRPNARKQQLSGLQFTTPEPLPKPSNRRYLGTDPTVRRLFGDWIRP